MEKNTKPDSSKTAMLVISMGFLVMFLVFHWQWAIYVSLGIGVIGIASPFLSRQVEWAWMQLAKFLGYIMPNVLLSIVFFIFLFPLALLQRLGKKDPLMLSKKYKTYFIDINAQMDKKSFEKIW